MTPKVAIKMILLVSGVYWGTYVPGFATRVVIFNAGFTWDDLDYRRNITAAILFRMSHFLLSHCSSALNPVIYFYTHAEVKAGLKKLLGRIVDFPPNEESQQAASTAQTVEENIQ